MRIPSLKKVRKTLAGGIRWMIECPLYTLGIDAYRLGVKLAGIRMEKARKLDQGQRKIRSALESAVHPGDRYVWIHAASLGEFEQGRPMIERIKCEHPEYKVLLTFFSPSGYEVRKDYKGADCVCYLPFDTPKRVRRFLDKVKPEMAIFVKYEFWRNYLKELNRRGIPTYLISAVFRPDQFFFKKRTAWYGQWLEWYTKIFVQNEESRRLLSTIGITRVEVCGDTRFDRVAEIRQSGKEIPLLARFSRCGESDRSPVMMAGSSWPEDEAVYSSWFDRHPDVKLVIAPHEFDAERTAKLKAGFKNGCALMSEAEQDATIVDNVQVLVIDCFGLLSSAYAYCDVAYVGGGFGAGLHNINEAAVYDVPVIYGPNHSKFIEAKEMATFGGGLPIQGKEGFEMQADKLFYDVKEREQRGRWAGEYIREKIGATDKIYRQILKNH